MLHNSALSKARFQITPKRLNFLKDLSTLLAFLINFLMLFFVERDGHERETPFLIQWAITVLGFMQLGSSSTLIVFYVVNRAALITKSRWREHAFHTRKRV